MKTGIIIGKFAPLTNGHISFINRASHMCDKLLVILSFDEKWLANQTPYMQSRLTLKNRLLWLKNTFESFDHIDVDFVDETNIPGFPNGWEPFTEMVLDRVEEHFGIRQPDFVFSSEPSYDEGFSKYLPNTKHVVVDEHRIEVDISATRIREDVIKYWEYIPTIVRKNFIFKVAIVGPPNVGKTTLVKFLARHYNTSWTEDYTDTYVKEKLFGNKSLLDNDDLFNIAIQNNILEKEAIMSSNRMMISDTSLLNVLMYSKYMEIDDSVTKHLINKEHYDLYIFIEDSESSDEMFKTVFLDFSKNGKIIQGSYKDVFDQSVSYIDEYYSKNYK